MTECSKAVERMSHPPDGGEGFYAESVRSKEKPEYLHSAPDVWRRRYVVTMRVQNLQTLGCAAPNATASRSRARFSACRTRSTISLPWLRRVAAGRGFE